MKIIKIGAVWCNGCLVMKPRWQQIEAENPELITEYYDYDESPEVMKKYQIDDNLPVAIFIDSDGNELQRFNGEVKKDELLKAIETAQAK